METLAERDRVLVRAFHHPSEREIERGRDFIERESGYLLFSGINRSVSRWRLLRR